MDKDQLQTLINNRKKLTTGQTAALFHIHPNTLRFYEREYLSKVPRTASGHRRFEAKQLKQIAVLRCLFWGEWPGKRVRNASLEIAHSLRSWKKEQLLMQTGKYLEILAEEIHRVEEVYSCLDSPDISLGHEEIPFNLMEERYSVTSEQVRNWERNNLISIPRRGPSRKRYYTLREEQQIARISMLIQGGCSLALIHHHFNNKGGSLEIQRTGDHLLEVLRKGQDLGKEILSILLQ